MRWPERVGSRLRSAATPSPVAVEESASPSEATSAMRQSTPQATAMPVISAAEPKSCTLPQPKIGRRMAHSRRGSGVPARPETSSA